MKSVRLENMVKGWFVGDFEPSLYRTDAVEVGVKHYVAGVREPWHFHRIATEITVVVSGRVRLNEHVFQAGDIVIVDPGEGVEFEALADSVTAVVKLPGAPNDKYLSRN